MLTLNKQSYFNLVFAFTAALMMFAGCGKQEKKVEDMKAKEIKEKVLALIESKKEEDAIEYLEKFLTQHPEDEEISTYKLKLADLYLNNGKLEPAYQMFDHYKEFYPADSKAEYATYKSILSKFYQTLKVDCDQTVTDETIKLCSSYLNSPYFHEYKNDTIDIKNTCTQKLIDKEVYVFNFYLKKGKSESAKKRLNYLREKYLSENPALEARIIYLECKLADKQNKKDTIQEKMEILVNRFPDSQFTKMAKGLTAKTNKPFQPF